MKIALTRRIPGDSVHELSPHFSEVIVLDSPRPPTAEEIQRAAADCEVVICTVTERFDAAMLGALPKLKCLVTMSVGVDHVDFDTVSKRKIPVAHTPDVLTDATADLAWTLILGCARRLKPALRYLEEGKFVGWDPNLFLGVELRDRILGIVGLGRIGAAVAARSTGFGMKVIYTGSSQASPSADIAKVGLEELLIHADVVSLHCPLKPETHHMIGRRELGVMKPGAILVNTARGPIIDEAALYAHLRSKPEFFAGLDVFEKEPFVAEGLRGLPNALCVPHIGSATDIARHKMARLSREEAVRFAKGEGLKYEYKRDRR